MATLLTASKSNNELLMSGHDETKQLETLFSIEIFVHSLNEVVGLEYLDCANPGLFLRA